MDRLAKKCVITSGIVHGTLVLLLIVGPAFLASDNTPSSSEILTIIPDLASAEGAAVMGFGTPNGGRQEPVPPTPKPPTPQPKPPAPVPVEQPKPPVVERVKETPKEKPADNDIKDAKVPDSASKDPDAVEPPKKNKPVISLTQITRKPSQMNTKDAEKAAEKAAADERAKADAEKKRRAASIQSALSNISGGASSGVEVGPIGVSTGSGPSVAAFGDILRTIYFNNWHEPSDASSDDGIVKVTVTIARDGTVISGRITKSSGDAAVDRSVQRTLENVTFIKSFPEGWKESQRQFQLSFSLKAKRSMG